ncbi:cytosolic peptidylprolyl cis-trans isomerase, cyclophilin A-like protein [Citrifermentans bemidjiense Bem]|uniref:Peptidyl-prolyl cis-trans isomerase n=1 Tax=Citrifermentans bemidjiense (strain ATCC BAA-1014 / DSM 16622 / JCM 12645 / Bem) TaxID=404380 RepID=B5EG44_CITBB|nr:peptidylprolyl isomerase [Citrifermentans bemidjiense]ACH40957.1 cytosolic peptidylprolyl cis-trans isomerase, cyclophilin A-like protein [Citrifermentans bemidjiense Bem]
MLKRIMLVAVLLLCFAGSAFAAETKNPVVVIETSQGNVKVELFEKEAPLSVKNFLEYAKSGFYEGTTFHRVIPGFMIQGGGLTKDIAPKATRAPIKNEANNGLKNDRGTLAMARTGMVDSATSQFFINVVNNGFLNHNPAGGQRTFGYAVFGKVLEGMDVVDKIAATPTGFKNGMPDVPATPVVIQSVKVVK